MVDVNYGYLDISTRLGIAVLGRELKNGLANRMTNPYMHT